MLGRSLLSSFARSSAPAPLRSIVSYSYSCRTSKCRGPAAPAAYRTLSTLPNLPLFRALRDHDPSSTAVVHSVSGRTFTYGNLAGDVLRAKERLAAKADGLAGERVAFLAENGYDYVGTVSLSLTFFLPLFY